MMETELFIGVLSLLIAYLGWKGGQFQSSSEMAESIKNSYDNVHIFNDADLQYHVVSVVAVEAGFPERLYKYFPFLKQEGFVDVQISITPSCGREIRLPSVDRIEQYDLFPSGSVRIVQANWTEEPVSSANLHLRIFEFNDLDAINAIQPSMASIAELMTGDIDERYHAQFEHTTGVVDFTDSGEDQ